MTTTITPPRGSQLRYRATRASDPIEAVQWCGDLIALEAIQDLLRASGASPYLAPPDQPSGRLGVPSSTGLAFVRYDLTFVDVGVWIVRESDGRVRVVGATEFEARYVASTPDR